MNYQAGNASLFATATRNTTFSFSCSLDCKVGPYTLREGEPLRVISDGDGLYSIYVEWGEGSIARLNANDINKLAGYAVTGQCICLEHIGDNWDCQVHGKGK